jgi:heme-degrading monooxygenase HmoA
MNDHAMNPKQVSGLRHIVMWTLKEEAEGHSRYENMLKARDILLQFANLTPGIELFEVGVKSGGLDCTSELILNSVFKDEEALKAYQNHPDHLAIKPFMKAVVQQRHCMDFWT